MIFFETVCFENILLYNFFLENKIIFFNEFVKKNKNARNSP